MNEEQNKNQASRGPLIFTMPASCFLVALNVDWLEGTDWAAVAQKRAVGTAHHLGTVERGNKRRIGRKAADETCQRQS